MTSINSEVLAGYNAGIEKGRLRSGLGLIEFERTKEILLETLPPAPAVIYDIGGGYGEYAFWLSGLGYDVHLYDLAEKNIEMAREYGEELDLALGTLEVADARSIDRKDESADALLLLGPLYHIVERSERELALRECHRLLKPGGLLYAAAITRYATTLWAVTAYGVQNDLLDEDAFFEMLREEIVTGHHVRNPESSYRGLGRAYFHLPAELKTEVEAAGFKNVDVRGVIGPGWLVPHLDEVWKDKNRRERILRIVRLCEREAAILGLSTHILSLAEK